MYYLIEHNRATKETTWQAYENYSNAQSDCAAKEQRNAAEGKAEMEVVVFEANSIDDVKKTHSRYFVQYANDLSKNTLKAVGAVGLICLALILLNKK